MNRKQKALALILCVCFIAVSFFAALYIDSHADHACSGEHCEICLQIAHLQNTLKQFQLTFSAAASVVAVAIFFSIITASARSAFESSLISLKVQMNN